MQQFREAAARGRADAPQKIERDRQAREEAERARQARGADERGRVERAAAERVALEFPVPSQFQVGESVDAGEPPAREAADAASLERVAEKAREVGEKTREEARQAREADDKERPEELARHQARGMPPEVVELLEPGQAPPPSAAAREPPGHAPSVVVPDKGKSASRGITRDR